MGATRAHHHFFIPLPSPNPPAAGNWASTAVCAAGAQWAPSALRCQPLAAAACLPAAAFTLRAGALPVAVSSAGGVLAAAPWAARANGSLGAAWWPTAAAGFRCTHAAATVRCVGAWSAATLSCALPSASASRSGTPTLSPTATATGCPAGTFAQPGGAGAVCTRCAAGYFCPPGTVAPWGIPCGAGNYCPAGAAAPLPCPMFGMVEATRGPANGPAFDVDTASCYNQ